MNTGSNRQMYDFVCRRHSARDECKLRGAQNMTEAVWQLGRKQSYNFDTSVFERPSSKVAQHIRYTTICGVII